MHWNRIELILPTCIISILTYPVGGRGVYWPGDQWEGREVGSKIKWKFQDKISTRSVSWEGENLIFKRVGGGGGTWVSDQKIDHCSVER
jgi:hypothetical protein